MILAGDYAPGPCSVDVNISGNLVLANLEGPLLPQNHSFMQALKAGPNLYSRELPNSSAEYIFSLANNHLMDFGQAGMDMTIQTLHKQGIRYCGSGTTIQSARNPLIILDGEVSIGIIACCEAQFGVARLNQAGVAEFGPWIYREIGALLEQVDAVIISVHAGVEDSPWPSPYIRDLYRSFIDTGATIVHAHHSHVPQGFEQYHGGVIFYGLGNFAVNPSRWRNHPNGLWSLGAEIDLNSKPLEWRPMSFEIRRQVGSERLIYVEESSSEERKSHMQHLEICNYPLHANELFEALWQEVAVRAYYAYGDHYMGNLLSSREHCTREFLSILKEGALFRRFSSLKTNTQRLLLLYNMLACESHRQMLTTALGVLSGEIADLRNNETCQLADGMVPWPCKRD